MFQIRWRQSNADALQFSQTEAGRKDARQFAHGRITHINYRILGNTAYRGSRESQKRPAWVSVSHVPCDLPWNETANHAQNQPGTRPEKPRHFLRDGREIVHAIQSRKVRKGTIE